jgi:hypothetical protein
MAPHAPIYDPECEICKRVDKILIEQDYVNVIASARTLAESYKCDFNQLKRHINALDLDVKRLDNTDKLAARIEEIGLQRLEDNIEEVTVDHLIRLSEHKDKKEGRVVQRVQVTKPTVVVIRNFPSPLELEGEVVQGQLASDVVTETTELNLIPEKVDK